MTKAELLSALEWIKDDAELHITVPHPTLDNLMEVFGVAEVRYRLQPARVEIVAKYADGECLQTRTGAEP